MKILVAGGAGYVGSLLVPSLIEHGYEVDVIDTMWFGNHLPSSVNVKSKNLFDCKPVELEGYEQIIFLAGVSNDPMAEFDPLKNFTYNAALPAYLAFMARQVGVRRFIYASSCSVYGYTVNQFYDENSPLICSYPYGISKLQGERGISRLQDKDFSVISLRKGTISGYSPRMRFDLIVNTMFKNAIRYKKIVVNNPSIWRPVLDIRDAVSAYLRAIQADYSISGIFNVCSGNYTVGHVGNVVKDCLESMNVDRIKIELLSKEDFRNYKVTMKKAETILSFIPRYEISDIVENLFSRLRHFENYEDEKYYNIRVFKNLRSDDSVNIYGQPAQPGYNRDGVLPVDL